MLSLAAFICATMTDVMLTSTDRVSIYIVTIGACAFASIVFALNTFASEHQPRVFPIIVSLYMFKSQGQLIQDKKKSFRLLHTSHEVFYISLYTGFFFVSVFPQTNYWTYFIIYRLCRDKIPYVTLKIEKDIAPCIQEYQTNMKMA